MTRRAVICLLATLVFVGLARASMRVASFGRGGFAATTADGRPIPGAGAATVTRTWMGWPLACEEWRSGERVGANRPLQLSLILLALAAPAVAARPAHFPSRVALGVALGGVYAAALLNAFWGWPAAFNAAAAPPWYRAALEWAQRSAVESLGAEWVVFDGDWPGYARLTALGMVAGAGAAGLVRWRSPQRLRP